MRKYLASLPDRSESHKKTFALLVSGGFTVFIFAIWALVNIGAPSESTLAADTPNPEPSPLASMSDGLAGALAALKTEAQILFGVDRDKPEPSIESVPPSNTESTVRTSAIEIYGQ